MSFVTTSLALRRGLALRCPRCGEGKLLRGFTTPLLVCSHCEQDFGVLRADDGPAWATILITGHVSVPFIFWVVESGIESTFLMIMILIGLVIALSAAILPRAKGAFMALIWATRVREPAAD